MGLNFTGLGFSFGAKDEGLQKQMDEYSAGFGTMSERMASVGNAVADTNVGDFASSGDVDQINSLSESFEEASDKVGYWTTQSRDAAGRFMKDSRQMESDARKVGGGFNFIGGSVEKLDQILSQNRLQTFIQSISLARLNDIADGVQDIGMAGTDLTTGLEAEMHMLGKTTRATGANFGYTGKELKKFSSKAAGMAKGLAIDAGTAASALRAWDEAGSELSAMGLKNAKDVAKFTEAFGVNADVLRNSGLQMRNEFKLDDKEINQVIGAFTMMGQKTGDVGGALNQLHELMGQISRRDAMMGKELDSKDLANYAASTAALAAGFMQAGQSSDQARASAMSMSDTMIAATETFNDMFAGTADDISDFHEAFAISTGDINKSFESMKQGPQEFMAGMTQMVQHAKKTGGMTERQMNLMRGQLTKVFGKDKASELVNFFKGADDATLDLMATVQKAPADLGKLAKEGFKSSKTLADRFEEAEQRMVMSFRSINREGARKFVSDSEKQFKRFNRGLKETAGKGGLMGAFVKQMSLAHQIGVKAFIPEALRPMAALMGNVVTEMTPMIGALGAMGLRMKHMVNPFVLATAAVGGFYALHASNKKNILDQNKNYGKQTKALEKLKKQVDRRKKAGKDWGTQAEKIKTVETSLAAMRVEAAKEARTKTVAQVEQGVRDAIAKITLVGGVLVEEMKKWFPKIKEFLGVFWRTLIYGVDPQGGGSSFAAEMGAKLGAAVRAAAIAAYDFVVEYLSQWWKNILGIWGDDSTTFTEKVQKTFESSAGVIIGAFALAKFTPVFGILGKLIFMLGGPLVKAAGSASLAVSKKFGGALVDMVKKGKGAEAAAGGVEASGGRLTKVFKTLGKYLKIVIVPVLTAVGIVLKGVVMAVGGAVAMAAAIVAAVVAVVGAGVLIYKYWDEITEFLSGAVESFVKGIKTIWGGITSVFTDPIGSIKIAWNAVVGWLGGLIDGALGKLKGAVKSVKEFGGAVSDFVTGDVGARPGGTKEEQQLSMLKKSFERQGVMTDKQIADELAKIDKANTLKKVKAYDFNRFLEYSHGDVNKAMAMSTDIWAQAEGKMKWKAAQEALRAAEAKKDAEVRASTETTGIISEETVKQVNTATGAMEQVKISAETKSDEIAESVRGKTSSLFGFLNADIGAGMAKAKAFLSEKLGEAKSFVEENAPAKSIVIGEKSIAKIGPQAKKAFGKAGEAMDKFGGKFGSRFELTGKKSISDIAQKAFNRIQKAAFKLRDTMKSIWVDILERTALAVNAIFKDARALIGQMRTMAAASRGLVAAKQAEGGGAPPALTKTFRGDATQAQIYEAIHQPDWYYQDFQRIAIAQLEQLGLLAAAVKAEDAQGGRSAAGLVRKIVGGKFKAVQRANNDATPYNVGQGQ